MATLISATLRATAHGYVHDCGYPSAILSGIAPDQRHLDRGGYHCSVEDLRRFDNEGDYSNIRPDDHDHNVRYGAGIDISMGPADMRKHYARVYAVWKDHSDPRRRYFNCINTWPGYGDAVRLDFVANIAKRASDDHKWHVHAETRRRWVLDPKAARAQISVFAGESKAAWLAREEPPAVKPIVKPPLPKPVAPTAPLPGKGKPAPVKVVPAKPATPKPVVHKPGTRDLAYVKGKELQGADVRFVQLFIGRKRMGPPDGVAGPGFRDGVLWYQRMQGLRADGVVGDDTWRRLGVRPT